MGQKVEKRNQSRIDLQHAKESKRKDRILQDIQQKLKYRQKQNQT